MHGFIAEHAETRGLGSSVFGLDGNALLGEAFTVDFSYNTEIAPVNSSDYGSNGGQTIYSSSDPRLDWLDLSITINGMTHYVVGNNRYATENGLFRG